MTLDPFAHVDPIGTFLLPLLGVPMGWAKPVPVNPAGFSRRAGGRRRPLRRAGAFGRAAQRGVGLALVMVGLDPVAPVLEGVNGVLVSLREGLGG